MEEQYELDKEIDKYLDSQTQDAAERSYFYVSELGKSKKDIYNSIVNKKPFDANARVKRILENGNKVHERYLTLFAEMGILVAAEINAVSNDLIHGRLDALITDRKRNYVVEIKSTSMWSFNKLTKPSTPHMLQVQFYMYYTNIHQGFVLYENKNDQNIKCFYVELNKELVENTIKELKELKIMIKNRQEPKNEPLLMEDLEYK